MGTSLINHSKRNKLNISCCEYAVLTFIVDKIHKEKVNNFSEIIYEEFVKFFGENKDIVVALQVLEAKELITWNRGLNTFMLGNDAIKLFGASIEAQFDTIWGIGHRERDNKKKCKDAFIKALKIETFEVLRDKWKMFYDSCEDKQYLTGLANFLDVKYKIWEDVKEIKPKQTDTLSPINHDYKPR